MAHDEATKNHPGGVSDVSSTEKSRYARMYKTEDPNDGYKALELYLSKLNPKCDSFCQYPRKNWSVGDNVWYEARPVGVNSLDSMMKNISEAASLSQIYTNHSFRATAITLWSNARIPNRHIIAISGHRREQSLEHYNTRSSSSQLRTVAVRFSQEALCLVHLSLPPLLFAEKFKTTVWSSQKRRQQQQVPWVRSSPTVPCTT